MTNSKVLTKSALNEKVSSPAAEQQIKQNTIFQEDHLIKELKHYLPTQTPLKDFIHHNSLHAFQQQKFYTAIFNAANSFGYQVTLELKDYRKLFQNGRIKESVLEQQITNFKGGVELLNWKNKLLYATYEEHITPAIGQLRKYWKTIYKIDLDTLVQPILFRILSSYLDQGISTWKFPASELGFLEALRQLERNSFGSIFKTKKAQQLFFQENLQLSDLLQLLVGRASHFEQYVFDQQFSHRGWSGMVATIEMQPHTLLDTRIISLHDLIFFELVLEIDALEAQLGNKWTALLDTIYVEPKNVLAQTQKSELNEVLAIWQNAFEWSYYDEVLAGMSNLSREQNELEKKSFQAIFCIDERECSIRRHLENVDRNCETLGSPGFFGVEFYFQPQGGKFYEKLCPAPVTPKYLIKEFDAKSERKHELIYTPQSLALIPGFLSAFAFGFLSAIKLVLTLFRPKMSPAISNAFAHMDKHSELSIENKQSSDTENGLQIGFTIEEMAIRVEGFLRSIGLIKNFSPIIYVVAHGSSSANNPHHGAHDCGACSGRPGSVNAKVFAFMANHPKVREMLQNKGIFIPDKTQFVGALHDTAADEIQFYSEKSLTEKNAALHRNNTAIFEKALDLNAKERSRRFASIQTKKDLNTVRKAIKDRSVSMFEPRPELGHGTNTLCIVGGRALTKGLFLDRRAFLNSYDYRSDLDGKILCGVMKPLGPVCGGINLEYYFSRVDNYKLGAGTKLPHNVIGLIGVANSCDGDLRPGLPLQMIEVHDPVRLMIVVEHFPEVVLSTIQSVPEMYEWFINEWVHLVAIHPETNKFYYFNEGVFTEYLPLTKNTSSVNNFNTLIESAKEMETNYIADATHENLPVLLLNDI